MFILCHTAKSRQNKNFLKTSVTFLHSFPPNMFLTVRKSLKKTQEFPIFHIIIIPGVVYMKDYPAMNIEDILIKYSGFVKWVL